VIGAARDPLRLFRRPYFYQRFTFATAMLADPLMAKYLPTRWNRAVDTYASRAANFQRRLAEFHGRPIDDVMPTHSFAQFIFIDDQVVVDREDLRDVLGNHLVCFTLVWGVLRDGVKCSTDHQEEGL
jgi:hypothetical protein